MRIFEKILFLDFNTERFTAGNFIDHNPLRISNVIKTLWKKKLFTTAFKAYIVRADVSLIKKHGYQEKVFKKR